MTPLKIGACLKTAEIATHRDWLFEADRDIEIQDFRSHGARARKSDDRLVRDGSELD